MNIAKIEKIRQDATIAMPWSAVDYSEAQSTLEDMRYGCDDCHDDCAACTSDDEDGDHHRCTYGDLCEYCADCVASLEEGIESADTEYNNSLCEIWESASSAFLSLAEAQNYDTDEVANLLQGNWDNGAYMQDHGSCAMTICESWNGENLTLFPEEIDHLIEAMGGASERHETGYDEARADGMSRESAREFVKMGIL